jgi:hypothetical protein
MNLKLNRKDVNKIISKATLEMQIVFFLNETKKQHMLRKHISMKLLEVSLSCLHFSLMFSEGEVKSLYVLQVR